MDNISGTTESVVAEVVSHPIKVLSKPALQSLKMNGKSKKDRKSKKGKRKAKKRQRTDNNATIQHTPTVQVDLPIMDHQDKNNRLISDLMDFFKDCPPQERETKLQNILDKFQITSDKFSEQFSKALLTQELSMSAETESPLFGGPCVQQLLEPLCTEDYFLLNALERS